MSTTSPDERRERWLGAAVMVFSGLVVVTCSATREAASPQVTALSPDALAPAQASASASAPASSPAPAQASASAQASAPAVASAGPVIERASAPAGLRRFRGALDELEAGRRKQHVRVVWLGDSHTAADIWPGAVRRALQRKYGDGGPGFVHAGWGSPQYRHEKARVETRGKWRVEPGDYARGKPFDDGRLGLGGVRLVPKEPGAAVTIEPTSPASDAEYEWDLAYRLPDGAGMEATADEQPLKLLASPEGEVRHATATTRKSHRLTVESRAGRAQLLGLTIETKKPGLVLDTVGLNGARVGTFLGREAESWQQELKRRRPDLVVLAFGTNESSALKQEASFHEGQMAKLLERVRAAAPETDCLVITPVDRAGAEYGPRLAVISEGFAAAAARHRCAVWSGTEAMGGPGSMLAWAAESPPRGGSDGVHLTGKGYLSLGEKVASYLLSDIRLRGSFAGQERPVKSHSPWIFARAPSSRRPSRSRARWAVGAWESSSVRATSGPSARSR